MPLSRRADAVLDLTAADGRLSLTLDAGHPDPAKHESLFANDKIEKIRAALKRERDDYFAARFTEKPYTEAAPIPPISSADRKRGFVPFVPNRMATLYPNSVPRAADLARRLSCFACPGGSETMTVTLRSLHASRAQAGLASRLWGG